MKSFNLLATLALALGLSFTAAIPAQGADKLPMYRARFFGHKIGLLIDRSGPLEVPRPGLAVSAA